MPTEIIVDSNITLNEALANNPEKPPCPAKILAQQKLVTVHYYGFDEKLHRGQIVIHKDLALDISGMFELSVKIKFPIAKVLPSAHPDYLWDPEKLIIGDNVTCGYTYRYIADTAKLSLHAYGKAIDINPLQNPYIRYKDGEEIIFPPNSKWDPKQPGTLYKDHPLIKFMEARGWEWGGHWTVAMGRTDYMHLQKSAS